MRVMLDTNIFISMIFFPSAQTRELAKRLTDNHQIIVCDYVIEELRLVTGDKDFLVLDVDMPEIITMAEFLRQY